MCSWCNPHSEPAPAPVGGSGGSAGPRTRVAVTPGRMLRRRAVQTPSGVPYGALPGVRLAATAVCDYAELDRRARAVAARLGGALPPGSRVLLVYRPGPDFAGAFYGCLYAGMVAVPLLLGPDEYRDVVAPAAELALPAAVLTSGDGWTALPVDRDRVPVLEADGSHVGGRPVRQLADRWRPVGVMTGAHAYRRLTPGMAGDPVGGRLEPALSHGDLQHVLYELQDASRLGAKDEELGWIASVQGVEDAVWRLLLPVHEGRAVWETGDPHGPGRE